MFRKRHEGGVLLVADIDDMSVGVSIVRLEKGEPTILASDRLALSFEERSNAHSVVAITELLSSTTEKVLKAYMVEEAVPPHAAYAILHAPWTRFRTAEAHDRYEKPQAITKETIAALAKRALAESGKSENVLEAGVMHVYLNGYPAGEPLGKHAHTVSVIAFESSVDAAARKAVEETLAKLVPGRELTLRSGMSGLIAILHEHIANVQRYVVLDMGSNTTECAVIRHESLTETAVIPEGLSTILGRIAQGAPQEETLTQLRLLATDACSTDACKALKDSLARAEPDLVKAFGAVFADLAAKRRLPNAVMLSAPPEIAPYLRTFFSRIDFSQFTATMQPLAVEDLNSGAEKLATWKSGLRPDTSLAVAAKYVHILEDSK